MLNRTRGLILQLLKYALLTHGISLDNAALRVQDLWCLDHLPLAHRVGAEGIGGVTCPGVQRRIGEDGLSLARRLRSDHKLPIVMISARGEEVDRIVGLEVGADDYLPKPFNPRELLARVRAVLRRNSPITDPQEDTSGKYVFGPFRLEPEKRVLYRDTSEVDLSRAEFELLEVLVNHPNRVLSRAFIMERLGGNDRDPFDRSIDVRVTRLRHKIEQDPAQPRFVRTVWGIGYQFTPSEPTT